MHIRIRRGRGGRRRDTGYGALDKVHGPPSGDVQTCHHSYILKTGSHEACIFSAAMPPRMTAMVNKDTIPRGRRMMF